MIRLMLRPHKEKQNGLEFHLDRFDAYLDDEVICVSRQPLYDGARKLLARGYPATEMLVMRHAGKDHDSFEAMPMGELARWTIKERDRGGLHRELWRSYPAKDASGSFPVEVQASVEQR